jgi:hypothetical protein
MTDTKTPVAFVGLGKWAPIWLAISKAQVNPCTGMDDAHEADPDSNREWLAPEWKFARENAPLEVLIPMMIARYAGLRGQTIVSINRKQFEDHPDGPTGKAVRYTPQEQKKGQVHPPARNA